MRRTLLLTNDFPPRTGGIQSFLYELAIRMPADRLVVYAPAWPGAAEFDASQPFPVVRHPSSLMLPAPSVASTARRLLTAHRLDAVWFGAAAPLALLGPTMRRAGAERVIACTHGHEVGWSMVPGARQALRRIGNTADVVTFVSYYSRRRIAAALGPRAAMEHLAPGVDATLFHPDQDARARIRGQLGLAHRPVVACISRLVPRKGQDTLIRAWPTVLETVPEATLLIVGGGRIADRLGRLAADRVLQGRVVFTGRVEPQLLPAHYAAADVFAMPCRTRGGGLDVEGLGIVFLEASASGLPVVAGDSGGAPETVQRGRTGEVVDAQDVQAVAAAVIGLLTDPDRAAAYGRAGRTWVQQAWNWDDTADRLQALLT